MARNDLQSSFSHGFSAGVPGENFNLACVVLASFGDVQMVHAVISELVSLAVGDGMPVDKPHDTWLRVAGYSAAETGPLALFNGTWFWFGYKHGCLARLC